MDKRFWSIFGVLSIFLAVAACAGPSRVETDFGTSVKLSTFNQTLNPQAGKKLEPVTGLDGQAANALMDKYQKDFERPLPPPSYTISVGSLGK